MHLDVFNKIYNFHCPRWSELPSQAMLNSSVVAYINEMLQPIICEQPAITGTMIQNYSKWGYIPRPSGRKYDREQIAHLIVISVFKQLFDISNIKKGVDLQLRFMANQQAYNNFADLLENALQTTFAPIINEETHIVNRIDISASQIGTALYANTFALKLLGLLIVKESEYKTYENKQ